MDHNLSKRIASTSNAECEFGYLQSHILFMVKAELK